MSLCFPGANECWHQTKTTAKNSREIVSFKDTDDVGPVNFNPKSHHINQLLTIVAHFLLLSAGITVITKSKQLGRGLGCTCMCKQCELPGDQMEHYFQKNPKCKSIAITIWLYRWCLDESSSCVLMMDSCSRLKLNSRNHIILRSSVLNITPADILTCKLIEGGSIPEIHLCREFLFASIQISRLPS